MEVRTENSDRDLTHVKLGGWKRFGMAVAMAIVQPEIEGGWWMHGSPIDGWRLCGDSLR